MLVCWDADRLDLGRVGIRPRPAKLCTNAAHDLIDWARAHGASNYLFKDVSQKDLVKTIEKAAAGKPVKAGP